MALTLTLLQGAACPINPKAPGLGTPAPCQPCSPLPTCHPRAGHPKCPRDVVPQRGCHTPPVTSPSVGGGIVAETAVNLCGRIAACKYITGAQRVPRHIRPGEEMLRGEMKGSLQWNSCGISFPQEIFPPNPP